MQVTITHIDTASILLDINGYKILTDPTLDAAGKWYYHGSGSFSKKTGDPAVDIGMLQNVELVLLSHHQHKDNFDHRGREFTRDIPLVFSTIAASRTLPNITGLNDWESCPVSTTLVPGLRITAVPAQHHPWWVPQFLAGKVIGFIIEFNAQANGAIYISGDTVYFRGIDEIARRYKIDIAVIHAGSVRVPYLTGFGRYTMNSKDLLRTVEVLNPSIVIPVHYKGWTHFREREEHLRDAIRVNRIADHKTIFLHPGKPVLLN